MIHYNVHHVHVHHVHVHVHVIFEILEPIDIKKYSIHRVFEAICLCRCLCLYICLCVHGTTSMSITTMFYMSMSILYLKSLNPVLFKNITYIGSLKHFVFVFVCVFVFLFVLVCVIDIARWQLTSSAVNDIWGLAWSWDDIKDLYSKFRSDCRQTYKKTSKQIFDL